MNPSNLAFTGLSGNFMSQWNWWNFQSSGYVAPTVNDDLYFVGDQASDDHTYLPVPMTATPGTMEYMMMVSAGAPVNQPLHPNYDAVIPIDNLPTLHGVHLVSHYTGHASVSNGQRLGTLDLQTGNFDQLGAGENLYIGTALNVLGGTLNSTSNLGDVVHITGNIGTPGVASANIAEQTGPVTIGSTISLEGLGTATTGSGMAIFLGDYTIKNGADFYIGQFCSAESGKALQQIIPPPPAGPPRPTRTQTTLNVIPPAGGVKGYTIITVAAGGRFDIVGNSKGDERLVAAGTITVAPNIAVILTDPANAPGNSVTVEATGQFTMHAGSNLVANSLVSIDGKFSTIGQGTVKIDAIVHVTATGTLIVTDTNFNDIGGLTAEYGRLEVRSLVVNGTLDMSMNAALEQDENGTTVESTMTDFIYSSGAVVFNAGSKLKVKYSNATSWVRVGRTWNIIEALGNLVAPPAPVDPQYRAGPAGPRGVEIMYVG